MNEITDLISTLATKSDLRHFLSELEKGSRGLFSTSQDTEKFLSEEFSARVASAISGYAASKKIDLSDPISATSFFKELRGELENVPVVNLHVAFEPTRKQLEGFSRWFSESLSRHVVFDVIYDPSVIGGAVIEYEGRRGDFSLKNKIGEKGLGF